MYLLLTQPQEEVRHSPIKSGRATRRDQYTKGEEQIDKLEHKQEDQLLSIK